MPFNSVFIPSKPVAPIVKDQPEFTNKLNSEEFYLRYYVGFIREFHFRTHIRADFPG